MPDPNALTTEEVLDQVPPASPEVDPLSVPPTEEQQRAFLGWGTEGEEAILPPSSQGAPVQQGAPVGTPPAEPPAEQTGPFKTQEAAYKSWKEALKLHHRTAEKNNVLAEENARLKSELERRQGSPLPVPAQENREQLVERFVSDPGKFMEQHNQQLTQQIIDQHVKPMAQVLLQLGYRMQAEEAAKTLNAEDQALFRQMSQDGSMGEYRASLPQGDQGMSDLTLFRLAKGDFLSHHTQDLQQKVQADETQRKSRNARVTTERGGSPAAPAINPLEMSMDELKRLAYAEYNQEEHAI